MKAKKLLTLAAVAVLSLGLVACGSNKDTGSQSSSGDKTIVVGATPNPQAQILNEVVKPLLEKEGYKLDVKVFNDYVLPNKGLTEKSLDANYYQHIPYLDEYNAKNKTDIVYTVKVHLEPMGVYSESLKKVSDAKEGARVAVPNDATNESRALKLLARQGLIKVADKDLLTKNDITENPKKIEVKELSAEQLPTALKDVDLAVINSNYALQAKLNPTKDAIAIESTDSPYANILAVNKENKDSEKIKALSKALTSPEVKKYIEEKFNGAIIASF